MAERVRTRALITLLELVLPRTAIRKSDRTIVVDDGRRAAASWWRDGGGWRCSAAVDRLVITVEDALAVIDAVWPLDAEAAQALVDEHEAEQRREAEHLAALRAKLGTAPAVTDADRVKAWVGWASDQLGIYGLADERMMQELTKLLEGLRDSKEGGS